MSIPINLVLQTLSPAEGDGTNTTFTTTETISSVVFLCVDGLYYYYGDTTYPFTYSGTTITTTFVPSSGQTMYASYEAPYTGS